MRETKERVMRHAEKVLSNEGMETVKSESSALSKKSILDKVTSPSKSILKKSSSVERYDRSVEYDRSFQSKDSSSLASDNQSCDLIKKTSDSEDIVNDYCQKIDQLVLNNYCSSSESESSGGREVDNIINAESCASRSSSADQRCGDK